MNIILDIIQGKYDFIIPVSFVFWGCVIGILIFVLRYILYLNKKKKFVGMSINEKVSPELTALDLEEIGEENNGV